MKVLSGRQPWWWAILHAGKRIENRRMVVRGVTRAPTWAAYRGPILLHASAGCTRQEFADAMTWMREGFGSSWLMKHGPPRFEDMPRGGIVGRARIVDVIPAGSTPGVAQQIADGHAVDVRWWMPDQFGFVLADVQPLPFFACQGALGLFAPTPEMLAHAGQVPAPDTPSTHGTEALRGKT